MNSVLTEMQQTNAWMEDGPQAIISDAVKRQREEGWESVRMALSTTIRYVFCIYFPDVKLIQVCQYNYRVFILRGYLEDNLREQSEVGAEFIGLFFFFKKKI